jgi:triosephosphate isomerase (TIM)
MRKPMIAGNWKMQGASANNKKLVSQLVADDMLTQQGDSIDVVICPPFAYLDQVHALLASSSIALGAQDVSAHPEGAYTGQISASMLVDNKCEWVIVGHSERRQMCGETDTVVVQKVAQAIKSGLKPIICLGESEAEREQGKTEAVLSRQIQAVLRELGPHVFENGVIAYEPIWAIGTGLTATPEQAQDVHQFLRFQVASFDEGVAKKVRILYGGSVKPENATGLFAMPDIDGALVGGASLVADSFLGICAAKLR